MRLLTYTLLIATVAGCRGCIEIPGAFSAIPPGPWRATLQLTGPGAQAETFDERSNGMLPFNFNVVYDTQDSFHIELINGDETIVLDHIGFGRDKRLGKDTIRIPFRALGSYIHAKYEEDAIEGYWYAPNRGEDYKIPFRALHGDDRRFTMIDAPEVNMGAEWAAQFEIETEHPYPAVCVFEQDDDGSVTGTIMTETGDYRYLEGRASGDRMYLSTFDGSHAFLFEAKYQEDGSLSGIFRSGNHYKTYWTARRDTSIQLANPYELTYVNPGYEFMEFSFPDPDGNLISLSDPQFAGRPKIVQIMGTWCPNCHDETRFLVDYLERHPDREFEVIALAFERHTSEEKGKQAIRNYIQVMDIDYTMLYAGGSSKLDASEQLPMLNRVISYPTLVFLDRDNRIVKIHTGFNGPATDKYDEFVRQFEEDVQAIL